MIPNIKPDSYSPNGWKIEKTEHEIAKEHHQFSADRLRNILMALENLIVQIGANPDRSFLSLKLSAMKEVYETEMVWHAEKAGLYPNSRRNSE